VHVHSPVSTFYKLILKVDNDELVSFDFYKLIYGIHATFQLNNVGIKGINRRNSTNSNDHISLQWLSYKQS
jgi:hypothetical protein